MKYETRRADSFEIIMDMMVIWTGERETATYLIIIWLCRFGALDDGDNCAIFALTNDGGIKGLLRSGFIGDGSLVGCDALVSEVSSCAKAAALIWSSIRAHKCMYRLLHFKGLILIDVLWFFSLTNSVIHRSCSQRELLTHALSSFYLNNSTKHCTRLQKTETTNNVRIWTGLTDNEDNLFAHKYKRKHETFH